jgi:hypothetical protein
MTTLFISDLHLDAERPAITELFGRFVDEEARGADALYILGDLFEAWVGDDDPSEAGAFVAAKLSALAKAGVPVSFIRGPFVAEGFMQGGLAAALALWLLWLGFAALRAWWGSELTALMDGRPLEFLPPRLSAVVFLGGMLVGATGGWAASRHAV